MILKSASEAIQKYGFPLTMEYNNPFFHGTQKGICICLKDNETGKILDNSMPTPILEDGNKSDIEEVRMDKLQQILNDNQVLLIEERITQMENGKLKPRTIYYVPYYVDDHSFLKPTVLYDNISGATNVSYQLSVEVLFVEDNLNRYVTLDFETVNISVMDLVYSLFDNYELEDTLISAGIHFEEEDENHEEGYYLDFYDEAGNQYNLCFSRLDRLRDAIVSIRLISINHKIND